MQSPVEILLVEDNPGDVRLTLEAFKEVDVAHTMEVARSGAEAMRRLRRMPPYESAARPDLILLDLNLPRKGGLEILAEIKGDAALQTIPVIILTMSDADTDVLKSYELHANCVITKPVDLERFLDVARMIGRFWLTMVKRPPAEN